MEQNTSHMTSPRKLVRRRSHTRKASQDCIVNIAEARREIVNALHHHRSSTSLSSSSSSSFSSSSLSSSSYSSSSSSSLPCFCSGARVPKRIGVSCKHGYTKCNISTTTTTTIKQHAPFLMDPLPLPQPTWSTTLPSVLPTPPIEEHEIEWDDNLAAYTWWLGFLKNLDIKNDKSSMDPACPFGEEIDMEYFRQFSRFLNASNIGEAPSMEMGDQSLLPEEWLTVPNENSVDVNNRDGNGGF